MVHVPYAAVTRAHTGTRTGCWYARGGHGLPDPNPALPHVPGWGVVTDCGRAGLQQSHLSEAARCGRKAYSEANHPATAPPLVAHPGVHPRAPFLSRAATVGVRQAVVHRPGVLENGDVVPTRRADPHPVHAASLILSKAKRHNKGRVILSGVTGSAFFLFTHRHVGHLLVHRRPVFSLQSSCATYRTHQHTRGARVFSFFFLEDPPTV
jgi:hypothetical protein